MSLFPDEPIKELVARPESVKLPKAARSSLPKTPNEF